MLAAQTCLHYFDSLLGLCKLLPQRLLAASSLQRVLLSLARLANVRDLGAEHHWMLLHLTLPALCDLIYAFVSMAAAAADAAAADSLGVVPVSFLLPVDAGRVAVV